MAQNAKYNAAGQMPHLEYYNRNPSSGFMIENRAYNFRNQLTNIMAASQNGGSAGFNLTYNFSATQNKGKITSMTDGIRGETVNYAYVRFNEIFSFSGANVRNHQTVKKTDVTKLVLQKIRDAENQQPVD